MEGMIRVLLIHRNRLFREALTFVLAEQQNMSVIRTVAESGEVLEELERLRPDVIVLDLCLPGREGLGEARRITEAFPEAKILMMGLTELEVDVLACIEGGAAGYLSQDASLEDLLNNIHAVAAGEALSSPKVTGLLVSWVAASSHEKERLRSLGLGRLTRRELEVIPLIEEGLSNKEIAVRLQIEVQTVKNHVHNILEKLQLNRRREIARYARERGLVSSLR
ncbi:MAG: LuxR C-terminal-related transcriptional regulator [Candidatus Binatia bacterium]